jgi:hypothetical protein
MKLRIQLLILFSILASCCLAAQQNPNPDSSSPFAESNRCAPFASECHAPIRLIFWQSDVDGPTSFAWRTRPTRCGVIVELGRACWRAVAGYKLAR